MLSPWSSSLKCPGTLFTVGALAPCGVRKQDKGGGPGLDLVSYHCSVCLNRLVVFQVILRVLLSAFHQGGIQVWDKTEEVWILAEVKIVCGPKLHVYEIIYGRGL